MSECKPCDLAKNFLCSMNKDQKCLFTLISINVLYAFLSLTHVNVLTFALYLTTGYLLFNIVRTKLGCEVKGCDACFKEEKLKECYYNFHDKLNSFFDSVRNVVFLYDVALLVKTVITLLFVIYLGHSFSSPATILITIDVLSLIQLADKNEKLVELKNTGMRVTKKFIFDKIPKYQEKK